jgi:hypothetical protein
VIETLLDEDAVLPSARHGAMSDRGLRRLFETRVQRHRAKARAITVMASLAATRAEPHKPDNNTDPDESAAKADHAANEGNGARAVRANAKLKSNKSLAKSEFAYACDHCRRTSRDT